jgi:lipoate synthase
LQAGFYHVMSGPLVRSSYIAEQGYNGARSILEARDKK